MTSIQNTILHQPQPSEFSPSAESSTDVTNTEGFPDETLLNDGDAPADNAAKGPWPYKYCRDIHESFLKIASMESSGRGATQKTLFVSVLPGTFRKSTFSRHYNVWKAIKDHVDFKLAIRAGRTEAGEWARIRSKYEKKH
ncbi:hypothetical protein VNI00_010289 [Paramarasmius palmivorus]|uniref:Uncharacterized protein n=1 Tax=Paramarasmius palmivorus TaxID=297713 RepID=A0AAW0CH99_9AGAR